MAKAHVLLAERARHLDGAEAADRAVKVAAVGDRVDVRADENRRQRGLAAFEPSDDVAGGIDARVEAGVAKEPEGTFTDEQRRLMMQALLIERFTLQAHVETRELPIYNLVLLRADGRPGPELKPTAVDCAALRKERAAGGATPADPPRPIPNIDERVPCNQRGFFGPQGVTINASGRTLEQIATTLGTYADRTVVNKTGLKGEYDMLLKFRPEAGGPMGGLAPPLSTTGDPLSDLATLAIAVREQLGLRLESARGPVQVLVIDSISPPTEN